MKKDYTKLFTILQWVFVASCVLMAIGIGFNAGMVLMLVAAVLALPIKPIKDVWNKVLQIEEPTDTEEPEPNAKWWQLKKKKAQKQQAAIESKRKSKVALKPVIIALVFFFAVCFAGTAMENSGVTPSIPSDTTSIETTIPSNDSNTEPQTAAESKEDISSTETTTEKASTSTSPEAKPVEQINFDLSSIPAFSNKAYVAVNNNTPYFTSADNTTTSFESYSTLDSLGRCGVAYACIGKDLMPTEERGSIGSVKPSGWQTVKYDNVDGKYLYNRCHLIGFQLSGENANTKNLITGTRYINVDGMLPFENMVADYVKETNNHVLYRVTPIFKGNNLVASGVLMEAKSVEDNGEGILFCVFCYNNQPGITIDYATGESMASNGGSAVTSSTEKVDNPVADNPTEQIYILNTNTKKFHKPDCASAKKIEDSNKQTYSGNRNDLIAQGYAPCKNCNP